MLTRSCQRPGSIVNNLQKQKGLDFQGRLAVGFHNEQGSTMSPDDQERQRPEKQGVSLPGIPLKILVVAEMTGRDLATGRSNSRAERIRVDKDSFGQVLAGFGLRVTLDVPDRLSGRKDPLLVELQFPDLKGFRPEAVAQQVPATRDLLQMRQALSEVRSGRLGLSEARDKLAGLQASSSLVGRVLELLEGAQARPAGTRPAAAAPASPPVAAEGGASSGNLDNLLGMVETGATEATEPSRGFDPQRFDSLIRQLVASEGSGRGIDPKAAEAAVRALDEALGTQLDAILHHPEFRRLEAAWRSLKFLVDRTDFRQPIHLEILSTGREGLLGLYDDLVHNPESQGLSEAPLSMVLVDQPFSNTPEDQDLLRALAERGSALSVPIVASAAPGMLGLEAAGDLAKARGFRENFGGDSHAKWRSLRAYAHSRWLALVFNRFLLRPQYGAEGLKTQGFDYFESLPSDEGRPWANPGWAVATLAARSFARIGWCTDIMGQRASGMVEDLAVRRHSRPAADEVSFPLETVISDAAERDLNDNGLMTLSAALNGDRAYLRLAPSVHAPGHYVDPADKARARLQSTLPYQMFVSRVINYAMLLEGRLVPGRSAEQIQAGYDRALRDLLHSAGPVPPDAVQVRIVPNEEDASRQDLHLKIRWPGAQSLPGAGELELRWPLAG
jgi:type VI secretion system protein ImpC